MQQRTLTVGFGKQTGVVFDLGGTIGARLFLQDGREMIKPSDSAEGVIDTVAPQLSEKARSKIGKIMIVSPKMRIDSAYVIFSILEAYIRGYRKIVQNYAPDFVMDLSGTDSRGWLAAAKHFGIPRDLRTVFTGAVSQFHMDHQDTDAYRATKNGIELAVEDRMREEPGSAAEAGRAYRRGKMAFVCQDGKIAYPDLAVEKTNLTKTSPFFSRANRIASRKVVGDVDEGWKFSRQEEKSYHFPNGDPDMPFSLKGGFEWKFLTPGTDYRILSNYLVGNVRTDQRRPSHDRLINGVFCAALGPGNFRQGEDRKHLLNAAEKLEPLGVPTVLLGMSKGKIPHRKPDGALDADLQQELPPYEGDASFVGGPTIYGGPLAFGEAEVLLGKLLADSERLGYSGSRIVQHVRRGFYDHTQKYTAVQLPPLDDGTQNARAS